MVKRPVPAKAVRRDHLDCHPVAETVTMAVAMPSASTRSGCAPGMPQRSQAVVSTRSRARKRGSHSSNMGSLTPSNAFGIVAVATKTSSTEPRMSSSESGWNMRGASATRTAANGRAGSKKRGPGVAPPNGRWYPLL